MVETIKATVIPHIPHTALRIRAERDCKVFVLRYELMEFGCGFEMPSPASSLLYLASFNSYYYNVKGNFNAINNRTRPTNYAGKARSFVLLINKTS